MCRRRVNSTAASSSNSAHSRKLPRLPLRQQSASSSLCLLFLLLLSSCFSLSSAHGEDLFYIKSNPQFPVEINLQAAVLHAPPFATVNTNPDGSKEYGGFQPDLLKRLSLFAADDNVTLNFHLSQAPDQYGAAFDLVANDCLEVAADPSECGKLDMIVGNFYATPSRALRVDLSPAWLRSTISTVKYIDKTGKDYTTLTQAGNDGATVCLKDGTFYAGVVKAKFPKVQYRFCDGQDDCLASLKREECVLYASDELQLRYRAAWDASLEVTPESFNTQYIVWPRSFQLDPIVHTLLNRWVLAAVTNATLDELYSHYFQKALCPVGTAGESCELPCDPDHGSADAKGACVCRSTKWTGSDCSIEVPEEVNAIPPTLKYLAYAMFGINGLLIMGCGGWLWWQRQSTQVLVSQPFFLMLVLVGCLISSSTIIALGQEHEGDGPVKACMAIPWLYSVGFSITFGTLFAKIRRVYVIFRSAVDMRRNIVTVQETLIIIGVVLAVDLAILIAWTAIDPLEWERTVTLATQLGEPLESEGFCTSEYWMIFAGIMAALHLLLLAVGCYCCYVSRGIPTKFSEGKYVSIAMISNLQIFVVGVPILIILGTDAESAFFVRSVIIWMNDFVVVTLIFGNLIYSVHWDVDESTGQGVKAIAGRAIQQYSRSVRMSSRSYLGESSRLDNSDRGNSMRNLTGGVGADSMRLSYASGVSGVSCGSLNGSAHDRSQAGLSPPTLARKRSSGSRASLGRELYQEERIPPMIIEDPSLNQSHSSRDIVFSQLSASGNIDGSDGQHSRTSHKGETQDYGGNKTSWGGINLSSLFTNSELGSSQSMKEMSEEFSVGSEGDTIRRRSITQLLPVVEETSREVTSTELTPDNCDNIQSFAESISTANGEEDAPDQVAAARPKKRLSVNWEEPLLTTDSQVDEEHSDSSELRHTSVVNGAQSTALEERVVTNSESMRNQGTVCDPPWKPQSASEPRSPAANTGVLEAEQTTSLRKQGNRRSSEGSKKKRGSSILSLDSEGSKKKRGSSILSLDDGLADAIRENAVSMATATQATLLDNELAEALDGSTENLELALEANTNLTLLMAQNEPLPYAMRNRGRRQSSLRTLDAAILEAMADCSAKSQTSPSSRPLPLDHELADELGQSSQSLQGVLSEKAGPLDSSPSENETDQTSSEYFELEERDAQANKPKQRNMEDESDVTLRTAGTGSTMELPQANNLVRVGDP